MTLYTFGTPNGFKVSIALEEMGLAYDVKVVDIRTGDQHKPEFIAVNPNSKIPALVDGDVTVFESVAILIYLAEKTGRFFPKETKKRFATLEWSLFQAAGVGPMFGQFGHFSVHAKDKIPYAIDRYREESLRIQGVLDRRLANNAYLAGDEYTIADMATYPWIRGWQVSYKQSLDASKFPNLARWYKEIDSRPAVQRGVKVPS